jgi:hypothetical protein
MDGEFLLHDDHLGRYQKEGSASHGRVVRDTHNPQQENNDA